LENSVCNDGLPGFDAVFVLGGVADLSFALNAGSDNFGGVGPKDFVDARPEGLLALHACWRVAVLAAFPAFDCFAFR
jgi:hypothetical protein